MGILTAKDFLAAAGALPRETVEIPALGGSFILQCITAGQRGIYYRTVFNASDADSVATGKFLLVAMSLVDETGHRLFADDEASQLEGLRGDVIDFLFNRCYELSKLGNHHVDQLGARLRSDPYRRSLFRLAERLGMTVSEVDQRLSSHEVSEWFALSYLDAKLDEMVANGTDPAVAAKAVWETNAQLM